MDRLIDALKQFENEIKDVDNDVNLQKAFRKLAPSFLYGGYIQVRNDYRIYIRTVEFYFHSEKEHGIHDPIVYHRNRRDFNGNVLMEIPYFPPLTLHAHASGFDITFESEQNEYRASVLIRAYDVMDKEKNYLIWDKGKRIFIKSSEYGYNTQSTYLYDLLNGFSLGNGNDIKWVDSQRKSSDPDEKPRQNVFLSESDFVYKKIKGKRCQRPWSFTRGEQV
jgi:hypothetical protein